jgi:putative ABC transport system ATP-binding protein
MKPTVSIKNLNYYYGSGNLKKQVLFNINLDIYSGEIVIMTGHSGSGKTTLLSLIGALRSVQNGSLINLDRELQGTDENGLVNVRRQIGYIFQAHNLLPFLTAKQNVQMSIELLKDFTASEAEDRSILMLHKVGLGQYVDYFPEKLSGGQKQRVAIARALVANPRLILADEPTASLDSKTGRNIVNLLQSLTKAQASTILLVTHDNRILDIADRIIEMEDGRLIN